jgi:hypothetical protein
MENEERPMRVFGILMISTNAPGQLLLQDLSITRRRSEEGDLRDACFLSPEPFSLEAGRDIPYYGVSILELSNIRSIQCTPHQEVAV